MRKLSWVLASLLSVHALPRAHADTLDDITFFEAGYEFAITTPETVLQKRLHPPADLQLILSGTGALDGMPGYSYTWTNDTEVGNYSLEVHRGNDYTYFGGLPLSFVTRVGEVPYPGPPPQDCATPCVYDIYQFIPGTYDLFDDFQGLPTELTIVPGGGDGATPEPSALLLLGTGMLGCLLPRGRV